MHDIPISSWIRFSRRSISIAYAASMLVLAACDVPPANMTCTTVGESLECTCKPGFDDCDANLVNGCEVDLLTNPHHCGSCGNACPSNTQCMEGVCVCQGVMRDVCSGQCRDLATDVDHCGACHASVEDGDPCTDDTCVGGVATHVNSAAGIPCAANGVCDGNRICVGMGTACSTGSDCPSGFCADGVCCDAACDEPCMKCNIVGNVGTCIPVPANIDDPDAMPPCVGSSSCNGNGVCKGEVGATCTSNAECLSGHCDGGTCGEFMNQAGPINWEWHQDTSTPPVDVWFAYQYPGLSVSSIVVRDDGSVRGRGSYALPIFGMPSGGVYYQMGNQIGSKSDYRGPHPFIFDIDAAGQSATLQSMGQVGWSQEYNNTFSPYNCSGWCEKSGDDVTGPFLWRTGGDVGIYRQQWHYGSPMIGEPSVTTCNLGELTKSAPPSWSLGTSEVCAMQAWSIAGDDAGNTWIRHPAGLTQYDPAGQIVSTLPDPFPGIGGEIALGPQSEIYIGDRDAAKIRLAKADPSGMVQWSKIVSAPIDVFATDCFSYAVDATGNIVLAFASASVVDLGNGPMPLLGQKDLVLAKLDPQGTVTWSKHFGGGGFVVKSCHLQPTGSDDFAMVLDFSGPVDLGDGILSSSAVLAKFDAMGSMVWHADLATLFPFVAEEQSWALGGHPSGAVFVSGSGHAPNPADWWKSRDLRFVVAKFAP